MAELLPGLHQIEQILGPRALYQYVLTGRRSLLFDTGCASSPDKDMLPYFASAGLDASRLDYILISHADVDHFGGNARMREVAPWAILACHELDAAQVGNKARILAERYGWYRPFGLDYDEGVHEWLEAELGPDVPLDLLLRGGETILLDEGRPVRVLHLPGHSPGHLGLYDEANKAVIVIDAILGAGLLDMQGQIISPPPYAQIQPYLDAVDTLLALDFEHFYTAHYPNMNREQGRAFLQQTRDFVTRTHAATIAALRETETPMTLAAVFQQVNEGLGPFSAFAVELAKPVYTHLEQLVAEGRARRSQQGDQPTWEAI
jgi:glyoxylase-like metal-dependent hydrolase (beta-lactamase superfamily II)